MLGRSLVLDGEAHTIVGVMPPDFRFAPFWATRTELWAPLSLAPRATSRGGQSLRVFARLAPGATLDAARADVGAVAARLEREFPGTNRDVAVVPLKEKVVGDVRPTLLVLLGAVELRAAHRVRERRAHAARARQRARARSWRCAPRSARRGPTSCGRRSSRACCSPSAAARSACSSARSACARSRAWRPSDLPRLERVHRRRARSSASRWAVSLLTGVACGSLPALRGAAEGASETLRDGARGATEGARQHAHAARARRVGVRARRRAARRARGCMMRSVAAIQAVDPGFDPRGVLSAAVSITGTAEAEPGRREAFYPALAARLAAMPGVRAASAINHVPLVGDVWGTSIAAEGQPRAANGDEASATYRVVLPEYFRTMGIRLREGRDVAASDRRGATDVVVINEALARRLWPNESALGRRLTLDDADTPRPTWRTVVGVVANVVRGDWTEPAAPEVYVPLLQDAAYLERPGSAFTAMTYVVRADGDAAALAPPLRAAVWSMNGDAPVSEVRTMAEAVAEATARPRFVLRLLVAFAVVAAVLAAVGLYGVTSYIVSRRTREIGVRTALGATRGHVVRLVVGEAFGLVLVGLAIGAVGARALTRFMSGLLYGVTAGDPLTFAGVLLALVAVALAAAYGPARRALRADPLTALRMD